MPSVSFRIAESEEEVAGETTGSQCLAGSVSVVTGDII